MTNDVNRIDRFAIKTKNDVWIRYDFSDFQFSLLKEKSIRKPPKMKWMMGSKKGIQSMCSIKNILSWLEQNNRQLNHTAFTLDRH